MKLQLFQEIVEPNQSFDRLIMGLERLESVPFFQSDLIQDARCDVEIARVYANREFYNSFEEIVENDANWAYRLQRAFDEKLKDRDDIYLEVRDSEERRQRKGLPPRVVILPGWDMADEDRLDETGISEILKAELRNSKGDQISDTKRHVRERGLFSDEAISLGLCPGSGAFSHTLHHPPQQPLSGGIFAIVWSVRFPIERQ